MEKKKKSVIGWLNSLAPNCKEVSMLAIKEQETDLSFKEKCKLYFHIYVACKFCRLFRKQIHLLHHHIHNHSKNTVLGNHFVLDEQTKFAMQAKINEQLHSN